MSIVPITADNLQSYTTIARPKRFFASSSSGITGSISLTKDFSKSLKDLGHTYGSSDHAFNDAQSEIIIDGLSRLPPGAVDGDPRLTIPLFELLFDVQQAEKHKLRQTKKQEVRRFTAGTRFEDNFCHKFIIQQNLFSHYRPHNQAADWSYTNYNCLNFFTASNVPSDSAIIYPSTTGSDQPPLLAPSSSFTFDFYLKPKATNNKQIPYHAGTIMHMSSCYAVSLVSGSAKDYTHVQKPTGFRVLLQLSQSADVKPSNVSIARDGTVTGLDGNPLSMAFVSSDNSLKLNNWHHVCIRWSSDENVNGVGTISIDGKLDHEFSINKKSVMQTTSSKPLLGDPSALFIGNYYNGKNTNPHDSIARFFSEEASIDEGIQNLYPGGGIPVTPTSMTLTNPLSAELHELKIYDKYITDKSARNNVKKGTDLKDPSLIFYLPPHFVRESPHRRILETPFQSAFGTTKYPFNVPMSFGVNGLQINLQNFVRDFAHGRYPKLLHLTSSELTAQISSEGITANMLLYATASLRKRNLTVLPCDNGKFLPNFSILSSGSSEEFSPAEGESLHPEFSFIDDLGLRDLSKISLRNMVRPQPVLGRRRWQALNPAMIVAEDFDVRDILAGNFAASPENVGGLFDVVTGEDISISPFGSNNLTIFHRTGDASSNEVVFFDVSNLFYGDRIYPGTLKITDNMVSGSGGAINFTLKDDGFGNIYRADSDSEHATWSSVGTVLYDDGLIVIKSPHLPFFGKESFEIEFQGERNVHTMEYTVPLRASHINSSSNPSFKKLVPSENLNETAEEFVYLTGMRLHDNNLNVVVDTSFAQTVIKRDADRFLVRVRIDF